MRFRRYISRRRALPNVLQYAALCDAAREPIHRLFGCGGAGFWARASLATVDPKRDPCHRSTTIHACRRRGWLEVKAASIAPLVHVAKLTPAGAALLEGRDL